MSKSEGCAISRTQLINKELNKGALAMTTATARKTALENKHLRNCDYLRLSYLVLAKPATTGLVCAPLN